MSFLTPEIKYSDHLDRAKFLFIWRLSLVFTTLLLTLGLLFYFFDESKAYVTYFLGFFIAACGLVYLHFKHNFKVIFMLYSSLGSIVIQFDLHMISDSHHYPNFLWIVMLVILSFYGIGKIWGFVVLILHSIACTLFFTRHMYDHYEIVLAANKNDALLIAIEVPVIMLIISYLVLLDNKAHDEIQNDLIAANESLEETNREISKKDQEKTLLVKEIHHRVKNNLQIIISLLRLQMTEIKTIESKKHFTEAINRVMVMSSIHEKLYKEQDLTEFSLSGYIEDISKELKQFFLEDFPVEINIETNYKIIDLKTVVPLGLLLNELLSNSFKYAFQNKESGEISILIKANGEHFDLIYFDNGEWRDPGKQNTGFGLELINTLAEQLNGTTELKKGKEGTFYKFHLQKLAD